MNVFHVHSAEPDPWPSSGLSGRNVEGEMEHVTESENAHIEATEDVERNSEKDGLNTERVRKTTERQEEQQSDVGVFERKGHLTDDPGVSG